MTGYVGGPKGSTMRRVAGSIGAVLSAGSWVGIADKVFGLPGFLKNVAQWLEWASLIKLPVFLNYAAIGTFTALSLALLTFDCWKPRPRHPQGREVDDVAGFEDQRDRFMELAPLIQRQKADCRPLIEGIQGYIVPPRFDADYLELIGKLEGLGVGYPQVMRNTKLWYQFLVFLNELSETGQLIRARQEIDFSGRWD